LGNSSHANDRPIPKIAAYMTPQDALKQHAAVAAIRKLPLRGVIGLGTGSTAEFFIERLAALIQQEGREFVGVPTSDRSRTFAQSRGIPVLDEHGPWEIDVTVDGADEVSDNLDLIKGSSTTLPRRISSLSTSPS